MGKKGEQTEAHIAAAAQVLFARKGYSGVTMQDVCEAADISRGGLYRHFSSTAEIFAYIINTRNAHDRKALAQALSEHVSAETIFGHFIDSRFEYIGRRDLNIDSAFHEFASTDESGRQLMTDLIESSIETLSQIIELGNAEGIFDCKDPAAAARHVLWLLEGMAMHASILPLTEKEADDQKKEILAHFGYRL